MRKLRDACNNGKLDKTKIRIVSAEFSVHVPADTFVALGDANGLKQYLEARLIEALWPYNACINKRQVAVAFNGGFTSAEAKALGASPAAARASLAPSPRARALRPCAEALTRPLTTHSHPLHPPPMQRTRATS